MNTVLSLIYEIVFDALRDDASRAIACYVVAHPEAVTTMSVQKLADACYVSTGTVLKFCQMLGIASFSAFKKSLKTTIATRKIQLEEKYRLLSKDDLSAKLNAFTPDGAQLARSAKTVARIVARQKAIHLYGAAFPMALSLSFAEDCCILGYPVTFHSRFDPKEEIEGVHVLVTFSGRWIESDYEACAKISRFYQNFVLVTSSQRTLPNVLEKVQLPLVASTEYMNIVYLLFLDIVLYELMHLQ